MFLQIYNYYPEESSIAITISLVMTLIKITYLLDIIK